MPNYGFKVVCFTWLHYQQHSTHSPRDKKTRIENIIIFRRLPATFSALRNGPTVHHSQAQSETSSDETSQLFQWKQASVMAPMPVVFFTVIWEESILSLPILSAGPCHLILCHGVNLADTLLISHWIICTAVMISILIFSLSMCFWSSLAPQAFYRLYFLHCVPSLSQTHFTVPKYM